MKNFTGLALGCVLASVLAAQAALAQITPEQQLIESAAEALGGKERIQSVRTLVIEGSGQLAYQTGGGNLSPDINAPQKWININAYRLAIDLEHDRARLSQRNVQNFGFAFARNMTGENRINRVMDGNVVFNIQANGTTGRVSDNVARDMRIQVLDTPVTIIREALKPETRVSGLRTEGSVKVVDIVTASGDAISLAIDDKTSLPSWVGWAAPNDNYGEINYRTYFTGYQREGGLLVPSGYNTPGDFRDVVQHKIYVDKYSIDVPLEDMSAPAAVRSVAPPPSDFIGDIEVQVLGKGIWFIHGQRGRDRNTTVFEFEDHLVMYEMPISAARTKAIIDKARTLVPGKPLTHAIMSHHHTDHTGGLRTAISEGLSIIAEQGNVELIEYIAARPTLQFPDALGKNPQPVRVVPVDDHLKLKDSLMEIDIYHAVSNNHMANAVFVHVPRDRLLVQADLFDVDWTALWWADSYMENVRRRNLLVDKDVPVHGEVLPIRDVIAHLQRQVEGAQQLCARAESAGLNVQSCPVENLLDERDLALLRQGTSIQ